MNQYDLPRPLVSDLRDLFEPERDQARRRRERRVHRAGLHRRVDLVRRQRQHRRAGVLEHHVHLAAAAADLHALRVVGTDERLVAARDAAGLPDPGDDDHALFGQHLRQELADLGVLPLAADLVGRHERGQEADVRFRHFAARIRKRHQRQVERAAAQRAELRVDLHQRRVRIDLELERAVGPLFDVLRELADEAVAEIALVDRAARELVRDLEGRRLGVRHGRRRARAERPRAILRAGGGENSGFMGLLQFR